MAGILRSSSTPKKGYPSQELLDDLCSRFVLNVPSEDLESFERMLFLVEQAHWFYEDNAVEQDSGLKSLSLREFTSLMFRSCDALRPYTAHVDDIYNDFNKYKVRVPVSGAIILDEAYERCLLVKGWKSGASWSFPRGKRNKDEEDHTCAAREVIVLLYNYLSFALSNGYHICEIRLISGRLPLHAPYNLKSMLLQQGNDLVNEL